MQNTAKQPRTPSGKSLTPFTDSGKPKSSAHGKRGPKRYAYTVHDVAKAAGLNRSGVDWYAKEKELSLGSLSSVVAFCVKRARQMSKPPDLEFSWTQLDTLLNAKPGTSEHDSAPRVQYPRVGGGKRERREVPAKFDSKDLESVHAYVERKRWEACTSADRRVETLDQLYTILDYLTRYRPYLGASMIRAIEALEAQTR